MEKSSPVTPVNEYLLLEDYKLSAIDFGTTYCGVMYSLKKDFDAKNPLRIFAQSDNKGDTATSLQEPTSVLLTPERIFEAFGTEAEDIYKNLAAEKKHQDYLYFRRFKMSLHRERELAKYTDIEDVDGKKCNAITIFTMAIKCLKDRLMANIRDSEIGNISHHEIRWVITVPAIWSEAAKQYMREAADDAGIPNNQLTLALEPEVAAVFCKEISIEKKQNETLIALNPGCKFMVLDLGGGTVDITLQEVAEDGSLKQLGSPSGGDWGGVGIDDAFYSLIGKIVGTDVFKTFMIQETFEWIRFQREFETEKRKIQMKDDFSLTIKLPQEMISIYDKQQRKMSLEEAKMSIQEAKMSQKEAIMSLQEAVDQTRWKGNVHVLNGHVLKLEQCVLREFFDQNINKIIQHVENLFTKSELKGMKTILLVGGFAESSMVTTRITKHFSDKKVIVPKEAGSAVLKGAVIYGHNPKAISARVSPYTYGLHTRMPFNSTRFHEERKEIINGKEVIKNAFDRHIKVDEVVLIAEELKMHNFYVVDTSDPKVFWNVYRSSEKDPIYCDDKGCKKIGTLSVQIKGGTTSGKKRELGVRMICRGTELEAMVQDKETNEVFIAKFNFLKEKH